MELHIILLSSLLLLIPIIHGEQLLDEPNLTTVEKLLQECQPDALDRCDMCSLCQNGAFCRQTINDKQPEFIQGSLRINQTLKSRGADLAKNLESLKSLVDFTCYCVPGFTGNYCQQDIDECLTVQCLNNATCIDQINGFKCQCQAGFTGRFIILEFSL